jgi:hypothetical protein
MLVDMSSAICAFPDTPAPTGTTDVPAAGGGWLDGAWGQVTAWIDTVPPLAWVAAIAVLGIATVLLIPFLRSASFKAGARHGKTITAQERSDRRLLIAAMIPASLFWIAVLTGSGRGLIAFGRDELKWTGGWEYLVPLTLDGVAIAFALLAFRAVKKNQNPDRSVRIAASAMGASALINFAHEVGGSKLGAGYLAVLSMLGMLIFDELLAQFEEGAENEVRRKNPKFGLRWLTWPTNTVCAWVAWRNYPDETLKATIGNAVTHLEQVRRDKATKRAEQIDSPAWWMRLAPWAHVGALRVALDGERGTTQAERVSATKALETERADSAREIEKLSARVTELDARLDRQWEEAEAERVSAAASNRELTEENAGLREEITATRETLTADQAKALREQNETLTAEMLRRVAAAKAEASVPNLADRRSRVSGDRSKTSVKGSPKTPLTDEEAVQRLLDTPGDAERGVLSGDLREWSQKAIVEELSVGYSRAPRLLEQVSETQRQRRSETRGGDPDGDAEEHAS